METLINQFKSFLLELPSSRQGGKKGLSKVSIKNYLSDIRRFLDWLSQYQPQISSAVPQRLSSEHFQAYLDYLTHQDLPHSTISRHFSSLRRFATFIEIVYHQPPLIIPTIPSPDSAPKPEPTSIQTSSPNLLSSFSQYLESQQKSASTVRNYLSDIRHFLAWVDQHPELNTLPSTQQLNSCLEPTIIDQYSHYLELTNTPSSTSSRRLSSLNIFTQFATNQGLVTPKLKPETSSPRLKPIPALSWLKPKTSSRQGFNLNLPSFIQKPITRLTSSPAYRSYHQLPFTPYLHLALLVLFTSAFALFGFRQIIIQSERISAYPSTPNRPTRQLSFQGRLTDSSGTPIVTPINATFKLWDQETGGTEGTCSGGAGEDCLYSTTTCSVDPDQDGIFNILLGDGVCGSEIPADVFTENTAVWLEVEVATETLTPRQPIATVAYALNSETVSGIPVSASGSATVNTLFFMNSSGEIVLGEQNPSIVADSGNFTLQGEALTLSTTPFSEGDITIAPDGIGQVNFIGGTTTDDFIRVVNANLTTGSLISGYVGNDNNTGELLRLSSGSSETDRFVVTTGGQTTIDALAGGKSAFIVNQLNSGPIFTASASGTPKFTINNSGTITLANNTIITDDTNYTRFSRGIAVGSNETYYFNASGNINANNLTLSGTTTLNGLTYTWPSTQSSNYVLTTNGSGTLTWSDPTALAASTIYWNQANGAVYPKNATVDLLVGGNSTASAIFSVNSTLGSLTLKDSSLNTLFSVSPSGLVSNVPSSFTSSGNVSFAYDLLLTNQTASSIKSNAPLTIEAGESFESNDLTLKTYNQGSVVIDSVLAELAGGLSVTDYATISSSLALGTSSAPAGTGHLSMSGNLNADGDLTVGGTTTFGSQTYTWPGSQTNNYVLSTNGSGTLSWVDPASAVASTIYWTQTAGALHPKNATVDLLVGSNASASAIFRVDATTGNLVSLAGAKWMPRSDSTTALNIANAAGTSFVTFDTTNQRVGIGTTAPTATLEISKSTGAASVLITGATGHVPSFTIKRSDTTGITIRSGADSPHGIGIYNTNGEVLGVINAIDRRWGIGDMAWNDMPTAQLHIEPVNANYTGLMIEAHASQRGNLFEINSNSTQGGDKFVLRASGNVGIGTTSPSYKLDVNGDIFGTNLRTSGDLYIAGTALSANTSTISGASLVGLFDDSMNYISGNTNVQSAIKQLDTAIGSLSGSAGGWTDDGTVVRLTTITDRVGIGTTSPHANTKLGVLGGVAIGSQTYSDAQAPTNGLIVEGNVGIGTTAPEAKIDVAGTAWLRGNSGNQGLFVNTNGDVLIGTNDANTAKLKLDSNMGITIQKPTATYLSQVGVGGNTTGLDVNGEYLYTAGSGGLKIFNIKNKNQPQLITIFTSSPSLVYPHQVMVTGNYAYVLDGSYFNVVDISNKYSPSLIAYLYDSNYFNGSSSMSKKMAISGQYLFVAGYNLDKIAVVDISNPSNPRVVGSYSGSAVNDANSLYVDRNYLFVAGNGIFSVLDIRNPLNIQLVGTTSSTDLNSNGGAVYVSGKYAYVAASSSDKIVIIDISNPSSPSIVGSYFNTSYTDSVTSLDVKGNYLYFASYTSGGWGILDVSNPTNPSIVNFYGSLVESRFIKVSGENVYLIHRSGDYVKIYRLTGIESPAATIDSLKTSSLSVSEDLTIANQLYVNGGITSGMVGILSHGNLSVLGSTYLSGNVGIGTTSPSYKLDVNGDIFGTNLRTSGDLYIAGTALSANTSTISGASLVGLFDDSMNYISGNTNVQSAIKQLDTAIGSLSGSAGGWTDDGTVVRLTTITDRVGIGTTSPNANTKLGILGGVAIGSQTYSDAQAPTNGLIVEGNVGIGTTSPQQKLSVVGDIGLSGSNRFIGTTDNYALSLRTNNTDRVYITNDGNVGIGTTSPMVPLEVRHNVSGVKQYYHFGAGNSYWNVNGVPYGDLLTNSGKISIISTVGSPTFPDTLNALGMAASYSPIGVVGIATGYSGGAEGIGVLGIGQHNGGGGGNAFGGRFYATAESGHNSTYSVNYYGVIANANNTRATTHGPSSLYGVYASTNAKNSDHVSYAIYANPEGNGTLWGIYSAKGNNYFAGNVGIGTTAPDYKLDVTGDINFTGALRANGTAGTTGQILVSQGTSNPVWSDISGAIGGDAWLQGGNSFGATGILGTNDNYDLQFETNNTTRMTINTSGNVGIGTTNPLFGKLEIYGNGSDTRLAIHEDAGTNIAGLSLRSGTRDWYIDSQEGVDFRIYRDTESPYLTIKETGNVGIGNTAPTSLLSVGSSSQFQVDSSGRMVRIDGVAHTIDDVSGNLTLTSNSSTISLNDDVTFAGTTTLNGLTYTWPGSQTANYVLSTNGSGTLSWVDPVGAAATVIYWNQANGSLFPKNESVDLLVGGSATASAKFAFINVNSGTPTASISGTTANVATYLTGEGNLATTNMAPLTIGGSTTGSISLANNTAITGNLTTSGNADIDGTLTSGTGNAFQVDATGNLSSTGTTGITLSGAGADLTFSGTGDHDITASSGTLRFGAATLTGSITGNSQSITGLSQLTVDNLRLDGNTIDTTTGNLTLDSAAGQVDVNDNLNITGSLTVGTTTTLNNITYTWPSTQSSNYVLSTNGSGTLSWVDPAAAAAGSIYWTQTAGALHPKNATVDLLVGGNASSSAIFRVDTSTGNLISVAGSKWMPRSNSTTALNIANAAGTSFVTFDTTNQRVGIGTNSPLSPLSVGSSSQFQVNSSGIIASIDGVAHTIDDVSGNLTLTSNSSTISINDSLSVSGNITATGYVQADDFRGGLYRTDDRSIAPIDFDHSEAHYVFTSYNNNSSSPYADGFIFRGWNDSSGGNDNLISFSRGSIAARMWQQTFGSATNFTNYEEFTFTGTGGTTNYIPKYTDANTIGNSTIIDLSGNIGIGDTSPTSLLTVGNGDLFQVNSSGIIASIDGVAHTIDDVSGNLTLTSNSSTISLNDNVTFAGTTTLNNITYTWPSTQSSNYVLSTNGSGTLSWVDPAAAAAGSIYWTQTAGALHPKNATVDLLVGGNASSSAIFRVDTSTGNLISVAGSKWMPRSNSTTALNIANAAGTSFVTFDTTNQRVGIGTSSPEANLEIKDITNAPVFQVTGAANSDTVSATINLFEASTPRSGFSLSYLGLSNRLALTSSGGNEWLSVLRDTGYVGIGNTNPTRKLSISDSNVGLLITESDASADEKNWLINAVAGQLRFASRNDADDGGTANFLTIDRTGTSIDNLTFPSGDALFTGGDVGIGTTNPETKLDVTGDARVGNLGLFGTHPTNTPSGNDGFRIRLSSDISASDTVVFDKTDGNSAGVDGVIAFARTGNTGVTNYSMVIDGSGRVGIGTTSPTHLFEVASTGGLSTKFSAANGDVYTYFDRSLPSKSNSLVFQTTGSSNWFIGQPDSNDYAGDGSDFYIGRTEDTPDLLIDSSGNVGIGNVSPAEALDITGNLKLSGTTTLNNITYTWPASQSTNYVLTTDGSGGLSWSDPASAVASTIYWTQTAGALHPKNATVDLLVGSNATASAIFRVDATTGNLVSLAGAKWMPRSDSTSALNIANAAGTSFVTFDTTNQRVGIGTTNPGAKFEVYGGTTKLYDGDTSGSVSLDVGGNLRLTRFQDDTANNIADYVFQAKGNSVFNNILRMFYGGMESYAAFTVKSQLRIDPASGGDLIFSNAGSGSSTYEWRIRTQDQNFYLQHDHVNHNPTWPSTFLSITSSGNLGIGTTDPSDKLHIDGDMRLTGALKDTLNSAGNAGYVLTSTGTGTQWVDAGGLTAGSDIWALKDVHNITPVNSSYNLLLGGDSTASAKIALNGTTGRVGIGTTSAQYPLDVTGDTRTTGTIYVDAGSSIGPSKTILEASGKIRLVQELPEAHGMVGLYIENGPWVNIFKAKDSLLMGVPIKGNGEIQIMNNGARLYNTGTNLYLQGRNATSGTWQTAVDTKIYRDNPQDWYQKIYVPTTIQTSYESLTTLNLKAITDQTANLQEWQDPAGTALSVVDVNGNLGIGTTAPTEKLDVAGNATVSGNLTFTGSASTIANRLMQPLTIGDSQTGDLQFYSSSNTLSSTGNLTLAGNINLTSGDLQTGGTSRLTNAGNLTNIGTTQFNGLTYTWPTTHETSGYVLSNNGSGTLTWVDANSAASGSIYWTQTGAAVHPKNSTVDLLVGGSATSSAKFAVLNINSGTPTASISGTTANVATYLTGEGNLATTNMAPLTIGGSTTGSLTLDENTTITGNLALSGNEADLTFSGTGNHDITASAGTLRFGAATLTGAITGNSQNITGLNNLTGVTSSFSTSVTTPLLTNAGNLTLSATGANNILFSTNGAERWRVTSTGILQSNGAQTIQTSNANLTLATGGGNGHVLLMPNGTGNVGINNASPAYKLDVTGDINFTGALRANGTAGTTGQVLVSQGTSNPVWSDISGAIGGDAWLQGGNSFGATGVIGTNDNYDLQFETNNTTRMTIDTFGNIGINTTSPTARLDVAGTASLSGTLAFRGTTDPKIDILNGENLGIRTSSGGDTGLSERITVLSNGNIGIGDTTPASLLTIGNGDLFQINSSGRIVRIEGVAHTIDDVSGNLTLTSNSSTISLNDNVTFAGTTTLNGLTYTWPGSQTPNYVLSTDGSGTLTWVAADAAAAGSIYWTLTDEQLHPKNASWHDLMIGGTSTASAKFFAQANTGDGYFSGELGLGTTTPTAKLDIQATPSVYTSEVGNIRISNASDTTEKLYLGFDNNLGTYGSGYVQSSKTGTTWLPTLINPNGGYVGINNTSPSRALHVEDDSGIYVGDGTKNIQIFTSGTDNDISSSHTLHLNYNNNQAVSVGEGGTSNLYVSGSVGIGNTSPTSLFSVGSSSQFQVNSSGNIVNLGGAAHSISNASGNLTINSAGTLVLADTNIQLSGGSTTFDVYNNAADTTLTINNSSATYRSHLSLEGQLKLGTYTATPSGIAAGAVYYDTTLDRPYYFNGLGNWVPFSAGEGGDGSKWTITDGSLHPNNSTLDLTIGGSATSSAAFAFTGISSSTRTATISGNLALSVPTGSAPATSLNILNGGSFNLQTSVGGNSGLTSRLFISNDGKVGIGTTSPQSELHIPNGTIRTDGFVSESDWGSFGFNMYWDNAQSQWEYASNGYASLIQQDGTNGGLYIATATSGTAGNLASWSKALTIDVDGNVGIGTDTPQAKLDIAGASSTITNTSGDITINSASGKISFAGDSLNNFLHATASGQIRPGSYGSDPYPIGDGAIIYRSDLGQLNYYNGTSWQAIGSGSGSSYWSEFDGLIFPTAYSVYDLAVGGDTTDSAKFFVDHSTGDIKIADTTGTDFHTIANDGNNLKITGSPNGSKLILQPDLQINGGDILGSAGATRISLVDTLSLTSVSGFLAVDRAATISAGLASDLTLHLKGAASQTANYMAITSNGGSTGNIFVVDSSGNVGIGTTSPKSKLHLVHNNTTSSATTLRGIHTLSSNSYTGTISQMFGLDIETANAGSGTVAELAGLHVMPENWSNSTTYNMYGIWTELENMNSTAVINGYELFLNGHEGNFTNLYGVYQSSAASNNYFAGRVGVGTNTPSHTLQATRTASNTIRTAHFGMTGGTANTEYTVAQFDVSGFGAQSPTIKISSNNTAGLSLTHTNNFSRAFIDHNYSSATSLALGLRGSELVTILNSGNVGINAPSPTAKLHVRVPDSSQVAANFDVIGGYQANVYFSEGGVKKFRMVMEGWNDGFYIQDAENDNGVYLLQNSNSWASMSDARLKSNVVVEQNLLNRVKQLRTVTYNFRDNTNRELGMIAQELLPVFPEVVTYDGEYYGINYDRLGAIALGGIKEQYALFQDQQLQLDAISGQINQLQDPTHMAQATITQLNAQTIATNQITTGSAIANSLTASVANITNSLTAATASISGKLTAQSLEVGSLKIGGVAIDDYIRNLIAQTASTQSVTTDSADEFTANTVTTGDLTISNASGSAVAQIDNQGNANFQGNISSHRNIADEMEFIQNSYYSPVMTASSATSSATIAFDHQGNLINPDDNLTAQAQAATQTDPSFFDRFISLIVKNLTALNITSRSITTQELVSPLVDADQITTNTLTTNLIKPQSDSDLILSLNNQSATTPAQLLITDSQDNTVTSIDSSGNATFSGELVANSAKFDSLEVGNLKANQIEGLTDTLSQIKSASEAAKLFLDRLTAKHSAQDESLNATAQQLVSTSSSQLLSTLEDNFTLDSDGTHLALTGLSSDYAYFSDYLAVEGTLMTNDLYVENNLITSSISSPLDAEDQTLYLQPTGTGAINLLAGLLILDESGTVSLNGNLIVTGTLESGSATISGTLDLRATNLDNSDEATHSGFGQLLSIYNEQGEQVAGVDASGSAQFNNLTTRQIIIAASQNSTPSANQASTSSNTTIGTATIPAGELTTYIENNNISDTTLIYLTPISDTKNQVLYVKNKYSCPVDAPLSCQPFFTVAINQPTTQDIQFNYWLIQVQ